MEKLIALLRSFAPLSAELKDHLYDIVTDRVFKKRAKIQEPGQVCRHIWFIESGIIRIYHLDEKGREKTDWLLKAGDLFIATDSFFSGKPSMYYIEPLEDTKVWGTSHDKLQNTILRFPEFCVHQILIDSHYRNLKDDRHNILDPMSSKGRLKWFFQTEPYLAKRVPAAIIYSYLGFTASSLRKKFAAGNREDK